MRGGTLVMRGRHLSPNCYTHINLYTLTGVITDLSFILQCD